jgi:hypothetical protein
MWRGSEERVSFFPLTPKYHRYYESSEEYQKAINLYYKSKNMGKAVELCFLSGQFAILHDIGECDVLSLS